MKHLFIYVVGIILLLVSVPAEAAPAIPDTWSTELRASSNAVLKEGVEVDDIIEMTRKMIAAGLDDNAIIQAQKIIRQAIEQNLSPTPIYDKAFEGLAKGVSAPRLLTAMHQVRTRYELAHRLATTLTDDPDTQNDLSVTLAAAQAAGINRQNLEKISGALRVRNENTHRIQERNHLLLDSLAISRDLARRGIDPEIVGGIISGILTKGANASEIREVARMLNNQKSKLSINERAQICLQVINAETSSTAIMETLQHQNTFRNESMLSLNPESTQTGNGDSSDSGKGNSGQSSGSGNTGNDSDSGNSGSGNSNNGNNGNGGNGGTGDGNSNDGGDNSNKSSGGRGERGSSNSGDTGQGQSGAGR
jgi:hypothetical protein